MEQPFIIFQKYNDRQIADDIARILRDNGIEYSLSSQVLASQQKTCPHKLAIVDHPYSLTVMGPPMDSIRAACIDDVKNQ